jgi:hypothetical protein
VSGAIPQVVYNTARTGVALRYLYDEGVALRRITGILACAYAATHQDVFLDAMASRVAVNAAAWPDWNPGHRLDTAKIMTGKRNTVMATAATLTGPTPFRWALFWAMGAPARVRPSRVRPAKVGVERSTP